MPGIMGHTYYQNYGHVTYHVNSVLLHTDDLPRVHAYMRAILDRLGVRYTVVGGIEDHVHILGDFPVNRALSDIVRELKISTTMWLKQHRAGYARFGWQGGFGYRSIGAERYLGVKGYIQHQRKHHADKTYEDEISEMRFCPIAFPNP